MTMTYGFFHTRPGATQADGLYVDRSGRLFLWPNRTDRAYEIDEDAAVQWSALVMEAKTSPLFLLAVLPITALAFGVFVVFPLPPLLLSDRVLGLLCLGIGLVIGHPLAQFVLQRWLARDFSAGLERMGIPPRPMRRPPVLSLKPSEQWGRGRFIRKVAALLTLALAIAAFPFAAPALGVLVTQGDRLVFILCALVLLLDPGRLIVRQIKGIRLSDSWMYEPPPTATGLPHPHPFGPPGRTFQDDERQFRREERSRPLLPRLGKALLFKFLPIIVGGGLFGWALIVWNQVPLTPETLSALYARAVSTEPGAVILKWASPIRVCVTGFPDSLLRDNLLSRTASTLKAAGLQDAPEDGPCTVEITHLDGPRTNARGEPDAMGAHFSHRAGVLSRVRIEISPSTLETVDPVGMLNDSPQVLGTVATTAALWAVGFRGSVAWNSHYVDAAGHGLYATELLPKLHYLPAILPGMPRDQAVSIVRKESEAFLNGESD
ncbi:hypothetical protein [Rhodospirillum sp. A1_3_36]|uniref:hypothetical protein n=1 Tax=Rhodospirillum sp. A1_3_36 TaxID=3391666 RepID=UPI0039A54488